jgi:uncharacterized membrane protein
MPTIRGYRRVLNIQKKNRVRSLTVIPFQAIIAVLIASRRIYEQHRHKQFFAARHSLSERYRLSENVRSAQLLNPLIAFLIAVSTFASVFMFINTRIFPLELRTVGTEFYYTIRVIQASANCR